MQPEDLCTHYPLAWHMAAPGSWESIRKFGLLSTSELLRRYDVGGAARDAIESQRRPECIRLNHAGMPDALIRDNKPMTDSALRKCLEDGLLPADWYRILNMRTFFWLSRNRLRRLLHARAYRASPQTILTVDTRSLVNAHIHRIELSPINSGSTIMKPVSRGKGTFKSIAQYDFEHWRKKRGKENAVVELCVFESVTDIANYVIAVHDWDGRASTEVWRRDGAGPDVGP